MPWGIRARNPVAAAIAADTRARVAQDLERVFLAKSQASGRRWSQDAQDAYQSLEEGFKIEARAGVPLEESNPMPFGFIKKAIKKVGSAIKGTAKFVAGTAKTVAGVALGTITGERVVGSAINGQPIVIASQPAAGTVTTERTSGGIVGALGGNKTLVYGGIAVAAILLLGGRR